MLTWCGDGPSLSESELQLDRAVIAVVIVADVDSPGRTLQSLLLQDTSWASDKQPSKCS